MRVSFHLPSPRRSSDFTVDDLLTIARTVEDVGLHAVSASDHPFPVVRRGEPAHHTYDPFVLLSHVSATTSRLRLVFSLLVVPYRNPFLMASMLASLDAASRGRVTAGLGAGYARQEFAALGAEFSRRGGQIDIAAQAMRRAWSGEPVELSGDDWTADGNTLRPVPTSPIRLWRCGNGPAAIEHAARDLDGWMPFEADELMASAAATAAVTVDTLPPMLQRFRSQRAELRPNEPADVCLVRTNPAWNEDVARGVDQLGALADAGVTWIESGTAGRSAQAVLEDVHRLAEVATAAGQLDPPPAGPEPRTGGADEESS